MWGATSRAFAANLSKQQEQFCTSLNGIDDSERGWGAVDEEEKPTKCGWGSSASSRAPTTGWGMKNTTTVLRGWGASQSPAPPPDLTSKLKPQTAVKAKVEPKSPANPPPKVNGWGDRTQTLNSTETEKQAKLPDPGRDNNTDKISQGGSSAPNHRLPSPSSSSEQNSSSKDPRTQRTRTEPLENGSRSSETSTSWRIPPATRTKNTKPRPPASGEPNSWNVAKQMAARGYIPIKPKTTSTIQPRANSPVPPQDQIASAPRPKITLSKPAATIPPHRTAAETVGRKEPETLESERIGDVAQKKANPTKSTGDVVESTGQSPLTSQDKGAPQANQRKDMFILAQSESERFEELILLLENHLRRPAMLIVDRSRTDPLLLSALLSLAGFPAAPANLKHAGDSTSIRVICTEDLGANATRVSLIVNINMVDEFDQIGERMKYLEKNGVMKTILLPRKDSVRATNFASKLQDCGLPVPHQLESFLSRDDQ